MQLRFDIEGDVQLSRNIRVAINKIKDFKPFFKEAINIIEEKSLEIFEKEGQNVEKNPVWVPLKPETIKYKQRKYGSSKPLVNTGNLKNNRTKTITDTYGSFSFDSSYAVYHQKGGGNLPQRAIIDLDKKTNTKIGKAIQRKIYEDVGIKQSKIN